MRLLDLIRGALAGYVLKAIQTLAALAVLPFLVSDRALGLAGYGHAFTLLAATVVMSVVTDGFKVALSRSIARGISDGGDAAGRMLGAGTRLLGAGSLAVAGLLVAFRDPLLGLLGLPVDDVHRGAFLAAASMIVIAESSHGLLALLLARGRLDVVNVVQAVEVIARNAFFVIYYQGHAANAASFVGAFAIGALLRSLAYSAYAAVRLRADLAGATRGRLREVLPVLRYSLSVSLSTVYYFIFFRLSVPLVNAVLGGEAAGALALTLNISDTYLRGVLLAVIEPAIVPVAARLRLDDLRVRLRSAVCRVEALLRGASWVVTAAIAAAAPLAIDLWLGPELKTIALGTQIMIAAVGVQLSLALKRSISIGLGTASELASVATRAGLLALAGVTLSVAHFRSVDGVVLSIAAFCAVSEAIGATRGFAAVLGDEERGAPRRTLALAAAVYVPAVALGAACAPHGWLASLGAAAASALWATALVHRYLLPLRDGWETLRSLRRHAGRDLFSPAG